MTTYFDLYSNVKEEGYREGLFHKAIESIRNTNWGMKKGCLILLDDGSTKKPCFPPLDIPVYAILNNKHLGVQNSMRMLLPLACDLAEWVVVFDSDAVVKPDWVEKACKAVNDNPDAAGIGLFNSRFHAAEVNRNGYSVKRTTNGCGAMFRSAEYIPTEGEEAWEDSLTFMGMALGKKWVCPRPSLMNHLGEYGLSNNGRTQDYDPDF